MKNIFRILMAVLVLGATSCTTEDISSTVVGNGELIEVSFSASVADLGTRATTGDGGEVAKLYYNVFDASSGTLLESLSSTAPRNTEGKFTFNLVMVKGMTYDIVLWADCGEGSIYTLNGKTVTADYSDVTANNEKLDAFCKFVDDFDPLTSTPSFTLKRPFAQLNAATNDKALAAQSGVNVTTSSVKVLAHSQFDIAEGTTVGNKAEHTFAVANIPGEGLNGNDDYEYLSAIYLFVPNENGTLTNATYTFVGTKNGGEYSYTTPEYASIPLKQNYRTNILGSLLTKSTEFTVDIDAIWDGVENYDDYVLIDDVVLYNENTSTLIVSSVAGLEWVAEQTDGVTRSSESNFNSKNGTFKGMTIELIEDIDLNGVNNWTPIGSTGKASEDTIFAATFDGKGHTIKNLTVTKDDNSPAGLFASSVGVIKNLNLENVNINAHYKAGAIVGDGLCAKIENCTVNGGNITVTPLNNDDGNHAGGIAGYLSAEPTAYVKNCTVKNVTVTAYRDCGGVAGTANGAAVVTGNKIENCNIVANQLYTYKEEKAPNADVVVGRNINGIDLANNTVINSSSDVLAVNENEELAVSSAAGYKVLVNHINNKRDISTSIASDCSGLTIKLENDIDLFSGYMDDGDPVTTAPIADGNDKCFKGTFDGQGHTIKNLYQNGWALGYEWGAYGSIGLFSNLEDATVKNVTIESLECLVEGGDISFIAGSATGTCVFENITIKDSTIGTYNNGCGGIIGWSGAGNYTFKNITLAEDVVLGGLWGSFDSSIGGIVGQAEPGATYNFENVTINCRIDAYNDCTASYDYYNYRMCGMVVGRCKETTTIDGRNYPDLSKYNMTFKNVTVNYGDWMNYHYCRAAGQRAARVEPGYAYGGIPADRDHSQDTVHCMECIPFDQLIGGNQYAVKGLRSVAGVTVNYPASYVRQVSDSTELEAEIKAGTKTIELNEGIYVLPNAAQKKTLTLIGLSPEKTTIATNNTTGSYEGCNYALDGSTVTFENISINTPSTTYIGYARCKATYKNCVINGTYTLYDNSTFENCTFNVSGDVYNIWTWGAPVATFTNCVFNSDGKAMLLYGQANTKLTINDSTFNDNGGLTDKKAAVEIGNDYNSSYELIVNNTVVNGYEINDKGINTGTTLWANKNSMPKEKLNVVVDGVDVY